MTEMGVAEAKRRFSDLIDRVRAGERIVITRRGRAVLVLSPPDDPQLEPDRSPPTGLAAIAGALADWDDFEAIMEDVYASRRRARDRDVPELEP
jgi:prevent-host-death family protein